MYSVFAHVIKRLTQKYEVLVSNAWYLVGLLVCIGATNSPILYWYEVGLLLEDPCALNGTHISKYGPLEFGFVLYSYLFDVKEKKRDPAFDYVAYAWHLPTHNTRMSIVQFRNSMIALYRAIMELRKATDVKRNPLFYHHQLVAHLSQPCPATPIESWEDAAKYGVYGAGGLLSQHIIAVASILGILPMELLLVASISMTTKTWESLKNRYGFSDEHHLDQTGTLLSAISHRLGVPLFVAEELVCKTKQRIDGTEGRFWDTIPPGCPIYYVLPGENKVLCLACDGTTSYPSRTKFVPNLLDGYLADFQPSTASEYFSQRFGKQKMPPRKKQNWKGEKLCDHFPLMLVPGCTVQEENTLNNMKCLPIPRQETVIQTMISAFGPEDILSDISAAGTVKLSKFL